MGSTSVFKGLSTLFPLFPMFPTKKINVRAELVKREGKRSSFGRRPLDRIGHVTRNSGENGGFNP